jgi:protein-tyrosine phosphatase
MSFTKQRQPTGATNHSQFFAAEARLNRLHRLFKTHFNVTEPSLVLEPYLFLGNCISAHDINRLAKLGIRYVLNVAIRDVEVCPYYSNNVRTLTIDLRDDDRENILRVFDQAFAFIDEAKRVKSRVLVHCSHGQR